MEMEEGGGGGGGGRGKEILRVYNQRSVPNKKKKKIIKQKKLR